jgi:hypothetical protein
MSDKPLSRPYPIQTTGACSWCGRILEESSDVVVVEWGGDGYVPTRIWRAQHRLCMGCETGVLINFEDRPFYVFAKVDGAKGTRLLERIRRMYVEGVSLFHVGKKKQERYERGD